MTEILFVVMFLMGVLSSLATVVLVTRAYARLFRSAQTVSLTPTMQNDMEFLPFVARTDAQEAKMEADAALNPRVYDAVEGLGR